MFALVCFVKVIYSSLLCFLEKWHRQTVITEKNCKKKCYKNLETEKMKFGIRNVAISHVEDALTNLTKEYP